MFLEMVSASRFKASPSRGTYFQLLNYSEISSLSDVDIAKKLVVDHKLASIPISVFYHANLDEHFLRFCFAKKEETLKKSWRYFDQLVIIHNFILRFEFI